MKEEYDALSNSPIAWNPALELPGWGGFTELWRRPNSLFANRYGVGLNPYTHPEQAQAALVSSLVHAGRHVRDQKSGGMWYAWALARRADNPEHWGDEDEIWAAYWRALEAAKVKDFTPAPSTRVGRPWGDPCM
jgi:hypothetical protein